MPYYTHTHQQTDQQNPPASASASNPSGIKAQRLERFRELERMGPSHEGGAKADGELLVAEPRTKPKRPSMYKVVLLNDDFTPMDFVVVVLETIFRKPHEDAVRLMMDVHNKGAAICGVYTRDVAETKVDQAIEYARINDHPLQCVIEEE